MAKGWVSKLLLCFMISVLLSSACVQQPDTNSKPATAMDNTLSTRNISSFNMTRYTNLKDKLQPNVRLWIDEEANKISKLETGESVLSADLQARFRGQTLATADVETLALLVMMQAIQNQEDEINEIMKELHDINEAKDKLRQLIKYMEEQKSNEANNELRARFDEMKEQQQQTTDISWSEWSNYYNQADSALARVDPKYKLTTPVIVNAGIRTSSYDEINNRLDDMNEMSDMNSLKLQMMLDRHSKLIETLSNMLKKTGATQETIIQNLK